MPEPNEPANSSAGKDVASDMEQVSKAELEEMRAAKQFRDSVRERGQNINPEYDENEYLEVIEETAKKAIDYEDELNKLKGSTNGNTKPTNQPNPPVVPAGLSEEDRNLIKQANTSATTALLDSQFTRFTLTQDKLPEESQSKHTKQELLKVIGGPKRPLVSELLNDPQFEGNAFMVADYLLNESKEREARAKEGADRTAALNRAKGSANISSTTGAVPTGDGDPNKDLADLIAPSTVQ